MKAEAEACQQALANDDISFFVDRLLPNDRWRILNRWHDRCSFFDIETTGLEYDDTITVIACWHRGEMLTFVEDENLDDFLDLLDDIDLLVSFNGSTFDVPRVIETFHIPNFPCPHVDLRWPCYHRGWTGGLKEVTAQLNIQRPADLKDVDGAWAVVLWQRWLANRDQAARDELLRYCAADVLLLKPLTASIAQHSFDASNLWNNLPAAAQSAQQPPDSGKRRRDIMAPLFGKGSPSKLRTRRRS